MKFSKASETGRTTDAELTIGVVIPSGIGYGYSGPAIFLKRLMTPLQSKANIKIYAGSKSRDSRDQSFIPPERQMSFANYGPLEQIKWAVKCARWLLVDAHKLDIVHFHGTALYTILPAIACIATKKPYVLVPLGAKNDADETGTLSKFKCVRAIRRHIVRKAAGGFALGRDIADELGHLGLTEEKVFQIGNPVSEDFYARNGVSEDAEKEVIFVGSMSERKRPHLILEALAALKAKGQPDLQATFVGPFESVAYEDKFFELARELEVEGQITVTGFTRDVAQILTQRRGVFVLLSQQEGLPGALVEAMAAGYPSVVTDVGAMGEIVREARSGRVVIPTLSELASALEFILHEDRWRELSKNAEEYSREYYMAESVSRNYIRKLESLTRGRR